MCFKKNMFLKKRSNKVGCSKDHENDTPLTTSPTNSASNSEPINIPLRPQSCSFERHDSENHIAEAISRLDEERRRSMIEDGSKQFDTDIPIATVDFSKSDIKYSSLHNSLDTSIDREFRRQRSTDQLFLLSKDVNCEKNQLLERKTKSKNTVAKNSSRVGSADSLARQSLLAAQVLRLIPTQQARDRNFLHGRIAANSLLGAVELEHVFPEREIKILVGTWNMNGQPPPRELNDFILPDVISHVPEVCVIGTQESYSERTEWEISLQEVLGPSHVMLHTAHLGVLYISVFIRRDLIWYCTLPEDSSFSVRPGTAFRTKGAVAISFALFGSSFLFVTAHLTAHQEKVKERVSDIKRIIRSLDLPRNLPCKHRNKDVTNNFDYVIWCGDLNFRIGEPRDAVMKWIRETKFPLPANLPNGLLHSDQLTSVLSDGAAFRDFHEAPITFPPTYKYNPGTQQFDTSSKQRVPSYTDRILFKCKHTSNQSSGTGFSSIRRTNANPSPPYCSLKCIAYSSAPSLCSSDHKPVFGLFTAVLRPGADDVPLAAGLFHRDVYLEGIKRRAAVLDNETGSSTVCSLQ